MIARCNCGIPIRNSARYASTLIRKGKRAPKAKKLVQKPINQVTLQQAAQMLKAMKPTNTEWAAFELEIKTKANATQNINALRGRIFPPFQVYTQSKKDKIVVFAEGASAQAARQAGAHVVGSQELVQQILEGRLVPTKVLAHPSQLPIVQQLARFLGPKGLFPSARRGTVTTELAKAISEAKGGLDWKADTDGIVRSCIGRLHLPIDALAQNVRLLVNEVSDMAAGSAGQSATDAAASNFVSSGPSPEVKKRTALARVTLSSTQGPAFIIEDALA